jgi:hypothetical protein
MEYLGSCSKDLSKLTITAKKLYSYISEGSSKMLNCSFHVPIEVISAKCTKKSSVSAKRTTKILLSGWTTQVLKKKLIRLPQNSSKNKKSINLCRQK